MNTIDKLQSANRKYGIFQWSLILWSILFLVWIIGFTNNEPMGFTVIGLFFFGVINWWIWGMD